MKCLPSAPAVMKWKGVEAPHYCSLSFMRRLCSEHLRVPATAPGSAGVSVNSTDFAALLQVLGRWHWPDSSWILLFKYYLHTHIFQTMHIQLCIFVKFVRDMIWGSTVESRYTGKAWPMESHWNALGIKIKIKHLPGQVNAFSISLCKRGRLGESKTASMWQGVQYTGWFNACSFPVCACFTLPHANCRPTLLRDRLQVCSWDAS